MEERQILNRISRIVVVGYDLKQRLEALAAPLGMDASTLARRILLPAVETRERAGEAGEPEHE